MNPRLCQPIWKETGKPGVEQARCHGCVWGGSEVRRSSQRRPWTLKEDGWAGEGSGQTLCRAEGKAGV